VTRLNSQLRIRHTLERRSLDEEERDAERAARTDSDYVASASISIAFPRGCPKTKVISDFSVLREHVRPKTRLGLKGDETIQIRLGIGEKATTIKP